MNDRETQEDAKLTNAETVELLDLATLLEIKLCTDNLMYLHEGISYWTMYEAKVLKVLELAKNTKNLKFRQEYVSVQNATLEMILFNKTLLQELLALRS